jgi:hypothetical protein
LTSEKLKRISSIRTKRNIFSKGNDLDFQIINVENGLDFKQLIRKKESKSYVRSRNIFAKEESGQESLINN